MDDIKLRLNESVAARLGAAPASADKDELIEELSDNLYRRFLDMTGAGVPEEEAFQRALDDLGDVDELLAYLGVEPAADMTIDQKDGQTRITTPGGQTIVINGGDDEPMTIGGGNSTIIINTDGTDEPDEAAADRLAAEAERIEAETERIVEEAERIEAEAESAGGPEARTDKSGDTHYDYTYGHGRGGRAPESDLDAILANVGEICRIAMDQAKDAVKQAKDAIQRRTSWEKDDSRVKVHFDAGPDMPIPPTPPEPVPPVPPVPPTPPTPPSGWEFEAELDTDQGRFYAGAGPKERKDVVYGFGYDKAKGGFYAQWGEWKGDSRTDHTGPYFSGEDSGMHPNDDGSYSVSALKDLRGIIVQTGAGDVTISDSEAPDAGVIIDGDVDDLDVTCSADGILTIREGRTASSSFFSRRGIGSADVELSLPRRRWELLDITTASGDVELDGCRLDVDQLTVQTASGDLNAGLHSCGELRFHSASGDIDLDLKDGCADLHAETMSGDVTLRGQIGDAIVKTASGDIEMSGLAVRFLGSTMSGDVQLETSQLPQVMELSSKSGDVQARIPDAGPFSLRMKTVSGEIDCEFPMNYINGTFVYGDGSGPSYSMTSVSGDVTLERYCH